MSDPAMTIIVPVKDRPGPLGRLLDSIEMAVGQAFPGRTVPGVEVIVVDDRSARPPEIPAGLDARVVRANGAGPGAARNTGARAAHAEWLLFTDSDCVVDGGWLRAAYEHVFDAGKAVVQGDPTRYTRTTPFGALEESLYRHMYSTYVTEDRRRTSMLDSRNLMIRRSALAEAGGFDEGLDAMAESRVLSVRLAKLGVIFHFEQDMVIRHEAPRSVADEMGAKFRHGRGRRRLWGAKPPSETDMALRYFVRPMDEGIDPAYVVSVHLAFVGGYSQEVYAESTAVPRKVLEHVPGLEHHDAAVQSALEWLIEEDL